MSQRLTKKQRRKLRQEGVIYAGGRFRSNILKVREDIEPKTKAQEAAFESHDEGYNLMLHGCAGTGKSFLGMYFALKQVLDNRTPYHKVIIVRSAVPTRDQGFEPGKSEDKNAVYETAYPEIVNDILGRGDGYQLLKQQGMIEFTSTAYLRSLTFDDCYIVVDEVQSMNFHELDTVITRVGDNSKIIFCGDTRQNDLIKKHNDQSGLPDFIKIIERLHTFDLIEFYGEDVVRSGLVRDYILQKEKMGL